MNAELSHQFSDISQCPNYQERKMKETNREIPDQLLVLTFDDGNKSDATFVAPLLKDYGFGATFYITEGLNFLKNKEHYVTWEEVRRLHNDGFEIGNHTQHHRNVNTQSREELLADIEHVDRRCQEYGISIPETFCYPGYSHGPAAVEVLAERGFRFARRGIAPEFSYNSEGGRGPTYDPTIHHPLLVPTTGASGPDWSFEDFVWAVEQAKDGKITVLTFHGVPALEHPWVHTEPETFETYMKYLHDNGYTVIALRDLARYV
jgi:peptidoglycan-N-acetylglucosamine deacetylase